MLHEALAAACRLLGRGKLSILVYHQVLAEIDPMRPTEPTAACFDWQMQLLSRYFTPLSLTAALEHLAAGTLPANAVCVTFDDGYLNNLTVAQPILAKYGIPATVYVATAFTNGRNMWNDRIQDLCADLTRTTLRTAEGAIELTDWPSRIAAAHQFIKQWKYLPLQQRTTAVDTLYQLNAASEYPCRMMDIAQLQQLAASGVTVGAHTKHHPILKSLSSAEQQDEIYQSKAELEQWLRHPVLHFAYPNGVQGKDFDDVAIGHVTAAGFQSAVVNRQGSSTADTCPFLLNRFSPWDLLPLKFHGRLAINLLKKNTIPR